MQSDDIQPERRFSLGNLFGDLSREFSTLVRQETQLIKAEVSEKVADAKTGMAELAVAAAVLLVGFLILMLALVAGLNSLLGATALDYPWLSPFIVGLVLMAAGVPLFLWGLKTLKEGTQPPQRSGESLRRDTEVLKEQFK